MARTPTLDDLEFNDEDGAFALAKHLHETGELDPDTLSMIIQHMADPSALIARLEAASIEAQPR